jgi:N-acetylglutamate synthase-like GNAT family acetyltransferase
VIETPQGKSEHWQIRSNLRPGDIGCLIYLHGILYAKEYGWDCTFEGYVAESLTKSIPSLDDSTARLWIAEINGKIIGSIGIVPDSNSEAQLRWFLVHPDQRGRGLGRELLKRALQFSLERGFKSVFLWTVSGLKIATHLYQVAGFRKTEEKTHQIWGKTITEERYQLSL